MIDFLAFLREEWYLFFLDPIDYALQRGMKLIVIAIAIWILLFAARCAGGVIGL